MDERKTHVSRPNVLPIEGKAHQAQTFVAIGTTKEVCENVNNSGGGLLTRETKDVDAVEKGEHIRRDEFIDEHPDEGSPEEFEALEIGRSISEMKC